ncbi:MAG: DUF86 domain-containing protein [Balneolaceae bacterium]|nr:DUF86 domain-containing protein [Balneolaceae bacterium]
MSKRDASLLLEDMIEAANKIERYTDGMSYEAFINDEKTIDAVVRNFEIIGEAANRLGTDFHEDHDEIEWQRIRGFRNRIVHHYFGIDYEIVWSIIKSDLDKLKRQLQSVLDRQ